MNPRMLSRFFLLLMLSSLAATSLFAETNENTSPLVYYIPKMKALQPVNARYAAYLETAYRRAKEAGAERVVIELDTMGGNVSSAIEVASIIDDADIPTAVYVNKRVLGVGVLLALSAERIYMNGWGSIGATSPSSFDELEGDRTGSTSSLLLSDLLSAAENHGRNVDIVRAMALSEVTLTEGQHGVAVARGAFLTLRTKQAKATGIADGVAESVLDVVAQEGFAGARVLTNDMKKNGKEEATTFSTTEENIVFHIQKPKVFQPVNAWYANYLQKQYDIAKEKGANLVVLELDTPGGDVQSALEISSTIVDSPIDTVVYINKRAISAGVLLSISARYIYMNRGATIGAAEPRTVDMESQQMTNVSDEKTMSYLMGEFKSGAESYGRNADIVEAMVDKNKVLTRERHGVDCGKGKLLTLRTKQAVEIGFVDGEANSVDEVLTALGVTKREVLRSRVEFTDASLNFLTHPLILGILLVIGIVGAYIEFKTPGFGLGGSIAVLGFAFYFLVLIFSGQGTWVAPAVFILGIILLLIEIFAIPGFGVAGIMGIICMFAGVLLAFGVDRLEVAAPVVFFSLLTSIVIMVVLARHLPQSSLFKRLTLQEATAGYKVSDSFDSISQKEGVATSTLRPAGTIEVEGVRYDAISEGAYIAKGKAIVVTKVEGNRIVVEEKEA